MVLCVVLRAEEAGVSTVKGAQAYGHQESMEIIFALLTGAVLALVGVMALFMVLSAAMARSQASAASALVSVAGVGEAPRRCEGYGTMLGMGTGMGNAMTSGSSNSLYGRFFAGSYVDSEPPSPPPEVLSASECSSEDISSSLQQREALVQTVNERLAMLQTEMGL